MKKIILIAILATSTSVFAGRCIREYSSCMDTCESGESYKSCMHSCKLALGYCRDRGGDNTGDHYTPSTDDYYQYDPCLYGGCGYFYPGW